MDIFHTRVSTVVYLAFPHKIIFIYERRKLLTENYCWAAVVRHVKSLEKLKELRTGSTKNLVNHLS